jgi:hypothetical protein
LQADEQRQERLEHMLRQQEDKENRAGESRSGKKPRLSVSTRELEMAGMHNRTWSAVDARKGLG